MNQLPQSVLHSIKAKIEQYECETHHKHPEVDLTSGICISCCCENFHQYVVKKCDKAIGDAYLEFITQSLGNVK